MIQCLRRAIFRGAATTQRMVATRPAGEWELRLMQLSK